MSKKDNIIIVLLSVTILLLAYNTFLLRLENRGRAKYLNHSPVMLPDIKPSKELLDKYRDACFCFKIIDSENNTYGYDIFINDTLRVHQPNIPGIPGNRGFIKKESAEKVANYVIEKIRDGNIPPTITQKELNLLDALTN